MMRIALITDIHNGKDLGTKMGSTAPKLLSEFLKFVDETKPDLVVDLGDRVNHIDHDTDYESMVRVSEYFQKITVPHKHLIGNHDIDFLSREENDAIMNYSFVSHSEVKDGYTLIYWNADTRMNSNVNFSLKEEDFHWLEKTLSEVSYPAIIFSHVPLDNGSMNGNFYFGGDSKYPDRGNYPVEQGKRVRDIIERSGKVVLCLNGHAHWNAYSCIDGVQYVTLPSLTELFPSYPDPNSAWSLLTLEQDSMEIQVFGKTPLLYRFKMRAQKDHWISKTKEYSPVKIEAK